MRNDRRGRLFHYGNGIVETFYASGEKGPDVRADGKGDAMKRGYYSTNRPDDSNHSPKLLGPLSTRNKALMAARLERDNA